MSEALDVLRVILFIAGLLVIPALLALGLCMGQGACMEDHMREDFNDPR